MNQMHLYQKQWYNAGKLDDLSGICHSITTVVLSLLNEKCYVGHLLYMDNFYNSYYISKMLLEKKT